MSRNSFSLVGKSAHLICIDLQQERLVVTDIDGTITTSDVQGFVLPQVGVDAHHEDVIEFFSRVGHNGYQVVYLSARAMALAKNTREYLFEVSWFYRKSQVIFGYNAW